MRITFDADTEEIKRELKKLPGRLVDKVMLDAINKSTKAGKGAAIKALAAATGVKQKSVRGRITGGVKGARATKKKPSSVVYINTDHGLKAKHQARGGIAGMRRLAATVPGGFYAEMESGHKGVYIRTGEAKRKMLKGRYADKTFLREPIKEVAPIQLHPHGTIAAKNAFIKKAEERIIPEIKSQIKRRLHAQTKRN